MKSLCGADCTKCQFNEECKGCVQTKGCPFGKECFVAKYINLSGMEKYEEFKKVLITELNGLDVPGMTKISELYPLCGSFVNFEYKLPNGQNVKFLDDACIYLCNQVLCEFNDGTHQKCFGLVAGMDFLLVCEYGENGAEPEIVVYKRR